MRVLELFSGTGTLAKVAAEMGHAVTTVDSDKACGADISCDVADLVGVPGRWDMVWASPPCESFSVASIGTHWGGGKGAYVPKTEQAQEALRLIDALATFISESMPIVWYIENPRGVMRKVAPYESIPGFHVRHTVTYCQYGDTRMKPTDIWTNDFLWVPRQACHNNDSCHEAAPRGSATGTQGRGTYLERSCLPEELCREIVLSAEEMCRV